MLEHLEEKLGERKKNNRKDLRSYHAEALTLVPGDEVVEVAVDPSVTGMNGPNIPNTAPVTLRRNHGPAPIGPRRGGTSKKSTKSSVEKTRNEERASSAAQDTPHFNDDLSPHSILQEADQSSMVVEY
ncbi:hypothetical protein [Rhizobium sp. 007]|uniref:hypothetical protein n=1 Tax=Rhizobium sp. 007 TaxID=2785056 RepID=UPI001890A590|nr:hypothetical protein [Rhizobium sp. 007]QPB18546.1 hypothetical protein ISN39_12790 [Rhizobium sp. 007]